MKATREEYDAISRLLSEHVNGDDDIRGYDLEDVETRVTPWHAIALGVVIVAALYGLGWWLGALGAGR